MSVRHTHLLLPIFILFLLSSPSSAILPPLLTTAVSHTLLYARSLLVLSARAQLTTAFFTSLDNLTPCLQPHHKRTPHPYQQPDTTTCIRRPLQALANAYLLYINLDHWFFGTANHVKSSVFAKVYRLLPRAAFTEWVVRGDLSRITTAFNRAYHYFKRYQPVTLKPLFANARIALKNSKWYTWLTQTGKSATQDKVKFTLDRRMHRRATEYVQNGLRTVAAVYQPDVASNRKERLYSRLWTGFSHCHSFWKGRPISRQTGYKRAMPLVNVLNEFARRVWQRMHYSGGKGYNRRGGKVNSEVWWRIREKLEVLFR